MYSDTRTLPVFMNDLDLGLAPGSTIDSMRNARTHREKEKIALVAMLDLDDRTVTDLKLDFKQFRNTKSFCRIICHKNLTL